MPNAKVRARHLKTMLLAATRQPRWPAIRELAGPAVVAEIEAASGMDWLPVGHDLALARGLRGVLGPAGHAAYSRGMMRELVKGPLLSGLLEAATRAFGLDPGSWATWIPKGWALVYQDAGSWGTARTGPLEMALTLTGVPAECAADDVWCDAVGHALSGMVDLARATGGIELLELDAGALTARYRLRWKPGGAAPGPRPPPADSSS